MAPVTLTWEHIQQQQQQQPPLCAAGTPPSVAHSPCVFGGSAGGSARCVSRLSLGPWQQRDDPVAARGTTRANIHTHSACVSSDAADDTSTHAHAHAVEESDKSHVRCRGEGPELWSCSSADEGPRSSQLLCHFPPKHVEEADKSKNIHRVTFLHPPIQVSSCPRPLLSGVPPSAVKHTVSSRGVLRHHFHKTLGRKSAKRFGF